MCLGTNRRPVLPPTAEDSHNDVSSKHHIIDLSDTEDDEEIRVLNFVPRNISFGKRKRNDGVEKGYSSIRNFICEICTDTKSTNDAFFVGGCSHKYCFECVAIYVGSKIQENVIKLRCHVSDVGSKLQENVINIRCPVSWCGGLFRAEDCRSIWVKLSNFMEWKRCPLCKFYIERIDGCCRKTCTRCGFFFCLKCGDIYCKNRNWPKLPRSSIRRVKKKKKRLVE